MVTVCRQVFVAVGLRTEFVLNLSLNGLRLDVIRHTVSMVSYKLS